MAVEGGGWLEGVGRWREGLKEMQSFRIPNTELSFVNSLIEIYRRLTNAIY